jgi:hypothetical protein
VPFWFISQNLKAKNKPDQQDMAQEVLKVE